MGDRTESDRLAPTDTPNPKATETDSVSATDLGLDLARTTRFPLMGESSVPMVPPDMLAEVRGETVLSASAPAPLIAKFPTPPPNAKALPLASFALSASIVTLFADKISPV